jgi:head-tail adaptor
MSRLRDFDLRDRVRFERRAQAADGYGNTQGAWVPLFECFAQLRPTKGGETVIAARLQSASIWDLWVRASDATRGVTNSDRVVNARDPRQVWNIRWSGDLDGDRRWLLMQLEQGVADG